MAVADAGSIVKHAKHAPSHTDKTVARSVVASKTIIKAAGYNQKLSQELSTLEHQLSVNDKKIAMQNAKLAQLEAQLKAAETILKTGCASLQVLRVSSQNAYFSCQSSNNTIPEKFKLTPQLVPQPLLSLGLDDTALMRTKIFFFNSGH